MNVGTDKTILAQIEITVFESELANESRFRDSQADVDSNQHLTSVKSNHGQMSSCKSIKIVSTPTILG